MREDTCRDSENELYTAFRVLASVRNQNWVHSQNPLAHELGSFWWM